MKMNNSEKQYYDGLVSYYSNNNGRLSFTDRSRLSKLRLDLGIIGDRALELESIAKADFQRTTAERLRKDAQARDCKARKNVEANDDRIQREQLELLADEKRKKEERERKRIQEECDAKKLAERKKQQEIERQAKKCEWEKERTRQRRREQRHDFYKSFFSFLLSLFPVIGVSYGVYTLYQSSDFFLSAAIGLPSFVSAMMYWNRRVYRNWLYLFYAALVGTACAYGYFKHEWSWSLIVGWIGLGMLIQNCRNRPHDAWVSAFLCFDFILAAALINCWFLFIGIAMAINAGAFLLLALADADITTSPWAVLLLVLVILGGVAIWWFYSAWLGAAVVVGIAFLVLKCSR